MGGGWCRSLCETLWCRAREQQREPLCPGPAMEVKAEVPRLEYIAVSLKCEAEEPVPIAACARLCAPLGDLAPGVKLEEADKDPLDRGGAPAEAGPGRAWQQEYLVGDCPGRGGAVCMVCGTFLGTCGPSAAREHVLQHHAHSLGLSPEEKRNILEAWSQGGNLPEGAPLPCTPGQYHGAREPAEIEVLIDPEEQMVTRKRGQPRGRPAPRPDARALEPGQRPRGQRRRQSVGPVEGMALPARERRSKQLSEGRDRGTVSPGTTFPSEEAAPSSAPPEIRLFTDGSFPAGFTLRLYCRPQPASGGREIRKNPSIQERKSPGDRGKTQALGKRQKQLGKAGTVRRDSGNSVGNCPVSALPSQDLDPGVPRLRRKGYSHHGITRRLRLSPSAVRCTLQSWRARGKAPPAPSPPQAKPFDPAWRADFLMDYDAGAGTMVCMVCEYSLLPIRLGTVMRHIRQCHAETLHLPRGVRRAIREVWETRGPVPAPPQHGALKGE
ncbi:spindlin interactor and repressor of chromatin-binding protein isoform X1 [Dermochelys coriacea]|uniref:spindlin interactor and repressor of chromatin-binding protein isoform X1 n=1 Tax=Dermochelys coriacea TaxID=27794 RepID=UPI0018E852F1|nr:spindlin interactor and repressor of chromatin-binding protein isoform X1 [Dermochelys coriacea]